MRSFSRRRTRLKVDLVVDDMVGNDPYALGKSVLAQQRIMHEVLDLNAADQRQVVAQQPTMAAPPYSFRTHGRGERGAGRM